MKISSYINLILQIERKGILSEDESMGIDCFDDAVLILDDIDDNSLTRDGKPCYYITYGKAPAQEKAQELFKQSFRTLDNIFTRRSLSFISRMKAKYLLKALQRKIEKGQSIDLKLQQKETVETKHLHTYYDMIRLFTGGHIKYAFLIGLLLSTTSSKKKQAIASIGEHIGIIRQIDDDIRDYDENHHEPLGDILHHKKRLPELVFLLYVPTEEKVLLEQYLFERNKDVRKIKEFIFRDIVKKKIEEIVQSEITFIHKAIPVLSQEYKVVLSDLMNKYITSIHSKLNV